ncbi:MULTISPECIES: glycosyltransferase [unclassified Campylobacter]|uniref:glycosyltransferase n=1 Tax=unclassified Campylobacter TaxID=2593542 RepID=UPI0022E9FFE8|nr:MULTISPECIES: glycosyltransferase [unclassified Campylobacter]MDA3062017.1 glycosyltransferase [Campylobacter sp. JMF_14 EL1]MDA3072878.1 glycosyltransferase [Campylobacter sp. JMF_10 EL2]
MKILQIARMNKGSGVASFLMNYYRNIDKNKFEFIFATDLNRENENYKDEIEKLGGKFYIIKKYKNIFSYMKSIYNIIKTEKPDIIHSHEFVVSILPLFIAKLCGIKVRIAHSHSSYVSSKVKIYITKWLRIFFSLVATDLWACSKEAGEFLFGKNKDVKIINNAIEYEKFKFNENKRNLFRKKLNIDNKIAIGTVARFQAIKNYPFCIEVFEEFHRKNENSVLVICGDGELRSEIEITIQNKKLENAVILLGNTPNVNEILNSFDILLLTSHREGLPMVLVEAQANGLKCFAPSQAVPKICNINDKLIFLDNYDKNTWVDEIYKNLEYKRDNMSIEIFEKYRYEIHSETKKLENSYIELLNLRK